MTFVEIPFSHGDFNLLDQEFETNSSDWFQVSLSRLGIAEIMCPVPPSGTMFDWISKEQTALVAVQPAFILRWLKQHYGWRSK
ncbi:hypothetical protein V9K92_16650 [Phyllobacterium sp. CCNWLW109]|uniref:hypothetical protein n=1 Tax=Phyllobacterium sp. CCNWLW109 TaxID=3127479 RepID=UPI0030789E08